MAARVGFSARLSTLNPKSCGDGSTNGKHRNLCLFAGLVDSAKKFEKNAPATSYISYFAGGSGM